MLQKRNCAGQGEEGQTASHQESGGEDHDSGWQTEGTDGGQPNVIKVDFIIKFVYQVLITIYRVYTLMRENQEMFGETSFDQVKSQMDLYKA